MEAFPSLDAVVGVRTALIPQFGRSLVREDEGRPCRSRGRGYNALISLELRC